MKGIIMTVCLLLAGTPLLGQGIEFFDGTYQEALDKAGREGKNIFVDVYTSWCGPCKQMSAKVFTDKAVGDYFNANFVSLRLDAEKQADHGFFRHYQASAYPGFFWLDARGELLGTAVGYQEAAPFVATARKAVDSRTGQRMAEAQSRWDGGDRDAAFIKEYIGLLNTVRPDDVKPVIIEYISGLGEEELKSRPAYELMSGFMRNMEDNAVVRALLSNAATYVEYGDREQNMIRYYRMAVRSTIVNRDKPEEYAAQRELIARSGSEFAPLWLEVLDVEWMLFAGDFTGGIPRIGQLMQRYGEQHPYLYSQLLYTLVIADYFRTEVPAGLNREVIGFADSAMRLKPCQENLIYLAAATAKSGDYKRAYQMLASLSFYPDPRLSNAVYRYLDLPVMRSEYPW